MNPMRERDWERLFPFGLLKGSGVGLSVAALSSCHLENICLRMKPTQREKQSRNQRDKALPYFEFWEPAVPKVPIFGLSFLLKKSQTKKHLFCFLELRTGQTLQVYLQCFFNFLLIGIISRPCLFLFLFLLSF